MKRKMDVLVRLGLWIITAMSFFLAGFGIDDVMMRVVITLAMLFSLVGTVWYAVFFANESFFIKERSEKDGESSGNIDARRTSEEEPK